MRRFLSYRDFDWTLLAFVLALSVISVLEIYSATLHTKFVHFDEKQMLWLAAGFVSMFILSLIDYHILLDIAVWAYGFCLVSLVAVLAVGTKVLGARRWIHLPGGIHFQPSEWVKLILIVVMARFFTNLSGRDLTWKDIFKAMAIVGLPMLLVLKQPDLGTSLTYAPVLLCGLFLGGIRFKHAAILCIVAWVAGSGSRLVQGAQAVSEAAPHQLFIAGQRSSRQRLSDPPILDCRRFRRHLGTRGREGNSDPGRFPTHPLYRFHFCRVLRGTRISRSYLRPAVILLVVDAFSTKRSNRR